MDLGHGSKNYTGTRKNDDDGIGDDKWFTYQNKKNRKQLCGIL